ncbi:DNA-binding transcriptional regulator, FadR family [Desulfatibacillum alkenivorans DSM 16219]|jgi:DNA-binding FadR family transcriptional regulator|uniref:DNA-binding transcriptional regulator, FadR family n=1 Tax=Desulfatibacillum alkenivorans DSM 16219 TaxID=1121393 RepID=A0A1M6V710_9BACT|nr:GntR family transcriptional regulator [Desulfatibacillum alkenivorans]SHK77194.1 DNA-binding transcriptional regulator, FadR family [Desulfatibacillum alkenivorans DSM 16219]
MNENPMFSPVRVGRAGEDVALQIEAAIMDGRVKPGERLPSERDLHVQFGASRGVVREALRALKQKGLIEIKKGAKGGAFIKEAELHNASESLGLFLKLQRISAQSLIEFRESMDRTITTLAITRAEAAEKQELLEGAIQLGNLLNKDDPDMDAVHELDRRLNIRLARMTKNPVFEWIMRAVQLGLSSHDAVLYEDDEYRSRTAGNWRETAQAIADNEPLKALSYIGYHYVMLQKCLEDREVQEDNQRAEGQDADFWASTPDIPGP